MKPARRQAITTISAFTAVPTASALATLAASASPARAQTGQAPAPAASDAVTSLPHFAVEIRTGPGWDASKPPQEQAQFREHSAHLRRLREEGHILLGARYADKGLLVVAAADAAAVRALFDVDPSMKAGTFVYALHPFSVFYGGCVQPRRRTG